MWVEHNCIKEGIISSIETNMKNIDKSISRIEAKIDNFIDMSNRLYVTKEWLKSIELDLNNTNKRVSWLESDRKTLVWLIIAFITTSILTIIFK